jgi:drug/metabolite transporter (DMT)-like permease
VSVWLRVPTGLPLAGLLTLGSGFDTWVRITSLRHGISFATMNACGFAACAGMLWLLRSLGIVQFRAPSKATMAAVWPSAVVLVLSVLTAQQAIRYGNVVVHSLAQHLVALLAVLVDYLASGSEPYPGELVGILLVGTYECVVRDSMKRHPLSAPVFAAG